MARTLGRTIRQIKDASSELQTEIKKSGMDIKKDLNLTGIIEETAQDIRRPLDQYASDLDQAIKFEPPKHTHIPAFPTSDKNDIGTSESEEKTDNSISQDQKTEKK